MLTNKKGGTAQGGKEPKGRTTQGGKGKETSR